MLNVVGLMKSRPATALLCAAAFTCGSLMISYAQPALSGPPPAASGWQAQEVASGVSQPWGLTWLHDGRPIVTTKSGGLYVVQDGSFVQIPMQGLTQLYTGGQGGLMDIALHPDYPDKPWIYFTASRGTAQSNRTSLLRGNFDGSTVSGIEVLFEVNKAKSGGAHFGSRLLWLSDGTLLMSIGDGGNPPQMIDGTLARDHGQRVDSHLAKLLRLDEDGNAAEGNPDFATYGRGAVPELFSIGHRNIQGITKDPATGRIFANEHGPLGGDELNLIEAGVNYGWPVVTLGRDYQTGQPIGLDTHPDMRDPLVAWAPAHPPSGLAFYTGPHFPHWQGSLFSGGLASQDIRRIVVDENGNATVPDRLVVGARVRDVRQGPDGYLYFITDQSNGRLMRVVPTTTGRDG